MSANLYEMLLRHPQLLDQHTLILGAEFELPAGWTALLRSSGATLLSWDWLTVQQHRPLEEPQVRFCLPESRDAEPFRRLILLWPKAKPQALALLRLAAAHIRECWIIGANDAGGKSIGKAVGDLCTEVSKTDSARHCTLWQATLQPQPALNWLTTAQSFRYAGQSFMTLPGVFSHGKLDTGTAVLLEHLPPPAHGRLLDLGCGSGVIGLSMKAQQPKLKVTLADIDAFALHSARLNATRLGLEAEVSASDGLAQISGRFDFIFTNPPFHQGKETDYAFARNLFVQAARHLTADGQLWLVANRHLAYEDWAGEYFRDVQLLAQQQGFKLLCIHTPR